MNITHTRILSKVARRWVRVNRVTGRTSHTTHYALFQVLHGLMVLIFVFTKLQIIHHPTIMDRINLTGPSLIKNTFSCLCGKINNRKMTPHLESHFNSCISNLVDIWQRASVVKPSIGSQLQILGFLQLQLTAG